MKGPGRITKEEIAEQAHVKATPEQIQQMVARNVARFMRLTDEHRCAARVFSNWSSSQCTHRGKIKVGHHYWCGHHNPDKKVQIHAAEQVRRERWYNEREETRSHNNRLRDAKRAVLAAARGHLKQEVSFDDLMTATERLMSIEASTPATGDDDEQA